MTTSHDPLIDLINHLTDNDSKSLCEMTLKLSEETGELAKAVLTHEGTAGTGHRLTGRKKVVEEVADTMLVAYSIARRIGATPAEITEMIAEKALYWETLQQNEAGIDLKSMPFEIHITVKHVANSDVFFVACDSIGVKPIVLDLYRQGTPIVQAMTSSKITTTTAGVRDEVERIADGLIRYGFEISRRKVESIPNHPHAEWAKKHTTPEPNRYYEDHIAFEKHIPVECKKYLSDKWKIHFSRNKMKKGNDIVEMATLRRPISEIYLEDFREIIVDIEKYALDAFIRIKGNPHIVEYSLFDDNISDDSAWMQTA